MHLTLQCNMSKIGIIEIEKVSAEITTRFAATGYHPKAKDALHVEIIAFKDSQGRRELDLDDFTYSESWMELSADECREAESEMMKQVAKEFPNYE